MLVVFSSMDFGIQGIYTFDTKTDFILGILGFKGFFVETKTKTIL